MQKIKLTLIILSVLCVFAQIVIGSSDNSFDHSDNIKKNLEKLKIAPDSCLFLEQVAASYNALEDYDNAIRYYNKVVSFCPSNYHALFQIGTCLYRDGGEDSGLEYMDKAISKALELGDKDFHKQYIEEKKAWMTLKKNEK